MRGFSGFFVSLVELHRRLRSRPVQRLYMGPRLKGCTRSWVGWLEAAIFNFSFRTTALLVQSLPRVAGAILLGFSKRVGDCHSLCRLWLVDFRKLQELCVSRFEGVFLSGSSRQLVLTLFTPVPLVRHCSGAVSCKVSVFVSFLLIISCCLDSFVQFNFLQICFLFISVFL